MRCLACGSKKLTKVLDLGKQPLANNYGETKKYPLCLMGCEDCGHGQLKKFVKPSKLFSHYLYESGTSNTLRQWFDAFASLLPEGSVLDIASNDGTFLRACQKYGHDVFGIDPAKNLIPNDVPTICGFFGETTKLGWFDTITAFNVVAHSPNPLGILKGIKRNLSPLGSAYVMTSQCNQFATGQFDTIYHEHHSYFTPESMRRLADRAGLQVVKQNIQPIHGGSLLTKLQHKPFKRFEWQASEIISIANNLESKHKMVGVGAAAKGVVFLNATHLQLDAVVDEAKIKQGYTIPGTEIPIISFEKLKDYKEPLTFVYLAWNFRPELELKIRKLRPYNDEHISFFA